MEENELLLSLIKDHITHNRLVNTMSAAEFDTEHYYLNISDTIFKLAALCDDENETRYNYYIECVDRINYFAVEKWQDEVGKLAAEILETIREWQEEDLERTLQYIEYE